MFNYHILYYELINIIIAFYLKIIISFTLVLKNI